jgi:hypothetical protein
MTVYFDKENYINYLKVCTSTPTGADTLRMLKRQLSVHLNFNIKLLDDNEVVLHEEFQTDLHPEFKLTFGENKITRPLKRDSFPSYSDIYLINDPEVSKIKDEHSILVGSLYEEIECLSKLFFIEDYSFHFEKLIGEHITPENHLNILNLPFSSIVIIDRYMFKGPEVGGNLGLFTYNLEKILTSIFRNKKGPSRLYFIYQVRVDVRRESPLYDAGPDLKKMAKKIKKVVPNHCAAPDIFLIGVRYGIIDDEHDRYMISNYLRIKSGDAFLYFESTGKIRTDSLVVDHCSHGSRNYRKTTKALVEKVSKIIKEALSAGSMYCKTPSGISTDQVIELIKMI